MDFDVIVIGSGPGGYVAAIRCAQLGKKVAIIEKYDMLGGTCLNVGCIPSKALLDSSEHFANATNHFAEHGIEMGKPKLKIDQMMARKAEVVKKMNTGVEFLMKKNKITVYNGMGSFVDKNTVRVSKADGSEVKISATNIIIATGSKPTVMPFMNFDGKRIISSTEALELKEIPKHLIVIGAGVIGAELGSVYGRLGAKVTFVEFADRMIPTMDESMGKELQKALKKQFEVEFNFNTKVTQIESKGKLVEITAKNAKDETVSFSGDYCLVCIGRKPYTDKLNAEAAGVETDEKGRVKVNEHTLETTSKGIYAIGDVIRGAMLAHKAEEEGVLVAETLVGQKPHIHYKLIPGVVYTWPEVASVGATEEELKKEGREYKVGKFPYKALGRATASGDLDGLVKILADKSTDEVLGMHIIGARAADMIAEGVTAMEFRASAEDLGRISHAHPTYMEAVKEAALDASGKRSIHS